MPSVAIAGSNCYHFGFLILNTMKRKYKYFGSDGNGGFYESVTKQEYSSMIEAIEQEIKYNVHSLLRCEVCRSNQAE